MTNFAEELCAAAGDSADRAAVRLDDLTLSYAALDAEVAQAAGLLRSKGIGVGDRVGVQLPNVPCFPVIYQAALRLGAVVVPMNPLLKADEVAFHLDDAGCRLLVGWHGFSAEARAGCEQAGAECLVVEPGGFDSMVGGSDPVTDVAERADGDAAVIIYTSGTTGHPKGATLELAPRFDPALVLGVIERDRATTFAGVPTMYTALLHCPDRDRFDTSTLELCVSGGSAMPVEVLHGFDEAFGAMILEGYGLSETTGMASFNTRDRERKPGSIGVPVGGTEMRVVDDDGNEVPSGVRGEIVMRGPFVMSGYWGRPDATAETIDAGGWFHTGDIATVDDDGYFFIVDRKKDLIIRGGYNVYPREVEEVLYAHPDVLEAAVVGVPHADLGEEVGAVVVLKPGGEATAEQLREHVKVQIAAYKYPRYIWFTDELPKGPTGKILKREIDITAAHAAQP